MFQALENPSSNLTGVASAISIDDTVRQGVENLGKVGGTMHPLASRYVSAFHELQSRLQAITGVRSRQLGQGGLLPENTDHGVRSSETTSPAGPPPHDYGGIAGYEQQASWTDINDPWQVPGFEHDFYVVENMLMENLGWLEQT